MNIQAEYKIKYLVSGYYVVRQWKKCLLWSSTISLDSKMCIFFLVQWHRIFMVTTWTLTMVGFIIIFVEVQGWSQAQNPHAILGLVTTIICFFQPIGALFRPHPGSKNRPYFNWGHWFGGNAAHILASEFPFCFFELWFFSSCSKWWECIMNTFAFAVVTIFFAVKLPRAELPEWMDWILVAFVAFHVFMHFVFSVSSLKFCPFSQTLLHFAPHVGDGCCAFYSLTSPSRPSKKKEFAMELNLWSASGFACYNS